MLLAESHVLTSEDDFKKQVHHSLLPKGSPRSFVRFVYCLGYGERELVPTVSKNPGTSQFWKLLHACQAQISWSDLLRSSKLDQRIGKKIDLLNRLQNQGLWLVDASITACYLGKDGRLPQRVVSNVIRTCWDLYISDIVKEANPKSIVVIGKSVESILQQQLKATGIQYRTICQPQARLTREERAKDLKSLQDFCRVHSA